VLKSGNAFEVRVNSSYKSTSFIVRAKAPGRQPVIWKVTTGAAGQRKFSTTVDLSGHLVSLFLEDTRLAVVRVN
jgi:hypothetical protein